ncbi:hypothetical protein PRIPAC_90831 [Pristionchus pacificus]|uniref:Uncharacterized protein n=1 Tax=Pristionchus pacificus TaxID=54126 RepID=A0A2A6CV52_PRIPA|nr:hypothetical protein PRIPAC_90831 [Pristionchus pacificus]|eukprot:PDM82114.1 hypothetical protein PRIPAC_36507 [Pristionchus pacificus]
MRFFFILSLLALILAVYAQEAAAPTGAVDADGAEVTSAPLDFNNADAVDSAVAELAASQEEGDGKKEEGTA